MWVYICNRTAMLPLNQGGKPVRRINFVLCQLKISIPRDKNYGDKNWGKLNLEKTNEI